MDHKLPHLFLCLVVVGVCRLFLGQQPRKFFVQALDRGELFETEIVKGFLRRLVKNDVALMLRKILFGVSGFAISGVNLAGLGFVFVAFSPLSFGFQCRIYQSRTALTDDHSENDLLRSA